MNKKLFIALSIIIILLFILIFLSIDNTDLNLPKTKWFKMFKNDKNEEGYYVASTRDGGCIVLGYTESTYDENQDIYLIKIDKNGTKEWDITYGQNGSDFGKAIVELDDGYMIAGSSNSQGKEEYDYNAWIIRTDIYGKMIWNNTYGGIFEDGSNSIVKTKENNFVITGYTYSNKNKNIDLWIFKINETGNLIWSKTFGGKGYDEGRSVIETNDGYIIAGETNTYSNNEEYSDAWLLKVNKTGNQMWNYTFGRQYNDLFNQIIKSDNRFFMVGHVQNKIENEIYDEYYSKGYIVITDENGKILYERIIEEGKETSLSSVEKIDNGFLTTGYIGPYGAGEGKILVERIDNLGNRVWLKIYQGKNGDAGIWIDKGINNNYFVTGYITDKNSNFKDLLIMKICNN